MSDEEDYERYIVNLPSTDPDDIIRAFFSEEELSYLQQRVREIVAIYRFMEWEHQPEHDELVNFICEAIVKLRAIYEDEEAEEEIEYIFCYKVQVQLFELSEWGYEILLIIE